MKKFFGLLTGRDDTAKMRAAEASLGRPVEGACGPWTLNKKEKATADERLGQIRVPKNFDWSPKELFTTATLPYMKCSDWKKVMKNRKFTNVPNFNSLLQ